MICITWARITESVTRNKLNPDKHRRTKTKVYIFNNITYVHIEQVYVFVFGMQHNNIMLSVCVPPPLYLFFLILSSYILTYI